MFYLLLLILYGYDCHIVINEDFSTFFNENTTSFYQVAYKQPGIIFTGISHESIVVIPVKGATGVAISVFNSPDSMIPDPVISDCNVTSLENPQVILTNFYSLVSNSNTEMYNFSIFINCSTVDASDIVVVVQDMSDLDANYFIQTSFVGETKINAIGIKRACTLVSLDATETKIVRASIMKGFSFSITDSTPEKAPNVIITNNTRFPYTVTTPNRIFTTFFFDNIDVIIGLDKTVESSFCSGTSVVKQTDGDDFMFSRFPELAASRYMGVYDCIWEFEPVNENFYVEVELVGRLGSATEVRLEADDGFGVTFSTIVSNSYDYRGMVLDGIHIIPYSGTLRFTSKGWGTFAFRASFKLFDANKPVNTKEVYLAQSSYLVRMSNLASTQYRFITNSAFEDFQITLYSAPASLSEFVISQLDNCFVETDNSYSFPTRFSLRESFAFEAKGSQDWFLVTCIGNQVPDGYLLIQGFNISQMQITRSSCARMASTLTSAHILYGGGIHMKEGFETISVIQDDDVQSVSLVELILNGTSPLIVEEAPLYEGAVLRYLTEKDIPFTTTSKIVTYRIYSNTSAKMQFEVTPFTTKAPDSSAFHMLNFLFFKVFLLLFVL